MATNWNEILNNSLKSNQELLDTITSNNSVVMTNILSAMVTEESGGASSSHRSGSRWRTKERHREAGDAQLMKDYFVGNPVYSDEDFRRWFRMKQPVFLRLLQSIQQRNPCFVQRQNCTNRLGLYAHQKVTAALRMLAYGSSVDSLDEYLRIGESTKIQTLREFCSTVVSMYKDEYLRAPTAYDLQRLLQKAERHGFPGMIGSLDCMHWHWKNCPASWVRVFTGRSKKPTIILEAVASHDTWIWHAFFGVPGSRDDITTLGCSHLFDRLTCGEVPSVHYEVNGREYHMSYYLVDGIYPNLATFVHSIKKPISPQEQHFSRMQESYRKDVERAFGILQARFAIIKQPGRGWDRENLHNIMMTCIILHNIIVEDQRDEYIDGYSEDEQTDINRSRRARAFSYEGATVDPNPRTGKVNLEEYMMRYDAIQSEPANKQLQKDLIELLWTRLGQGN